jgi:hypothetical protein
VDVGYAATGGTLEWPVQIGNQMLADPDRAGGANSKDAWIEKYTISYSSSQVSIPTVTVAITQHLVPAAGKSVVILPVVPPNVATFLLGRIRPAAGVNNGPYFVRAEVVAKGHLGDGSSFETGPFTMVFEACAECFDAPNATFLCNAGDPAGTIPWVGSCPQPGQTSIPGCGQ